MTKPTPHYSPFGSLISNRSWSDASRVYRYGFNGKEKDFETSSDNYDFGARIYDGRLGRWLSVDPLFRNYSFVTPYSFVYNSPIKCIDPDGESVIIEYNDGKKDKRVRYDNGKYYREKKNGKWKEVKSKNALVKITSNPFVAQVVSDLEKLRSLGGEIQRRLEILEKSNNSHIIRKTNGVNQNYIEDDKVNQEHALNQTMPTGSVTNYNPSDISATGENRPSYIGLGHELLGHGYLRDQGLHFDGLNSLIKAPPTEKVKQQFKITETSITTAEVNACAFDNIIRLAHNNKIIYENQQLKDGDPNKKSTEEINKLMLTLRTTHEMSVLSDEVFNSAKVNENNLKK